MAMLRITALLGVVALCGCDVEEVVMKSAQAAEVADEADAGRGLVFDVSEGAPPTGAAERTPAVKGEPLSPERVAALLARLPAGAGEGAAVEAFRFPASTLPAPKTGETVKTPFPPPAEAPPPADVKGGPLEVVRHQPEGDVPLAPHLSLTFSQPMVAVTGQSDAATTVPVTIEPAPPGRWRWVGTRTLLFEPDGGRFPQATEYTVAVPAGTKSANGGALAKAARWTFRTPPPSLTAHWPPDGPQRRDTPMFAAFDQRIDPDAVLKRVKVSAGLLGGAPALRRLTDAEVAAHPELKRLADAAGPGRWLAFRAEKGLPADKSVTVSFGSGTPSAEGPRTTDKAQSFELRTYGPFRVERAECGWRGQCPPLTPWHIAFTNPVDETSFDPSLVRVSPELPGLEIDVGGTGMTLRGPTRGRTRYTVTLDERLKDAFGQGLTGDRSHTFAVGEAEPLLTAQGEPMAVLDPAAEGRFPVYTVNHDALRVRIYQVEPQDWAAFTVWARDRHAEPPPPVPGRLLSDAVVKVEGARDALTETRIDVGARLGGRGQAVLVVEPAVQPKERWRRRDVRVWVQVTDLALDAFVDGERMVAWATNLADGKPLDGVDLRLEGESARTGPDGLATLMLPAKAQVLVARRGDDVALLPESTGFWGSGWQRRPPHDALRWYVFDDRHLYKPGETARVKGWIRRVGGGPAGDVGAFQHAAKSVRWRLNDARGNEVGAGAAALDAWGGFDLTLKLPAEMNLGTAWLRLEAEGGGGPTAGREVGHALEVQEFRRPEFEVQARTESAGPHLVGGEAVVGVVARYYSGGALPGAPARWRITATPGHFVPPGRDDFSFGEWAPWWMPHGGRGEATTEALEGRTDGDGVHRARLKFRAAEPPRAYAVEAEATVEDVNRQAWTRAASLLVHPSSVYVGLRTPRPFVGAGEKLQVEAVAVDLDGQAVTGRPVRVVAERLTWRRRGREWTEVATDRAECKLSSGSEPGECTFEPGRGGQWRVRAEVTDAQGRRNRTVLMIWVSGGERPSAETPDADRVTLVPDRREYQGGQVAQILVQAPFAPAEGLLTLRRSGLLKTERFRIEGATHTLHIPVDEAWVPGVTVQVDLVGAKPRDRGTRPAFASGSIGLAVPPLRRTLQVRATPAAAALAPGAETKVAVQVTDADGKPAADAQVALVVVDEAVLALTGYEVPDPLATFYAGRSADVYDRRSREQLLVLAQGPALDELERQQNEGRMGGGMPKRRSLAMPPSPPGAMMRMEMDTGAAPAASAAAEAPADSTPIAVRADFSALAVFAPAVKTGADGRAEVPVKLPDNLTRYRVTAVAVAGGRHFGKGDAAITARLPLMVRPSAPRFLNFGDRLELPVVLQNQTEAPLDVEVAVRASNLTLTAGAGRRLRVPAGDRVEVRFPAAAESAGTARFAVAAATPGFADAASGELPVYTPATTEAFATYGEIDDGAIRQPVQAPADAIPAFGQLEVTTSSTALQALTDAFLYLVRYPYECAEQVSSRILAIAALKDVLGAFEAEGLPPAAELAATIEADLKRLRGMQNDDGGFAFWRRGDESVPYVSVHVAHALARAKAKGFAVPGDLVQRSLRYLADIERRFPEWYGPEARRAVLAYALSVRQRLDAGDPARARRLLEEAKPDGLSPESLGWLMFALQGDAAAVKTIRRHLENRVSETAGTAQFATGYGAEVGNHVLLASSRRTDGVILEAFVETAADSDLIPKVVRGLLAHRTRGRWGNTQENAFVLLALDRYFARFEGKTPDFVAKVWLGERFAGQHAFKGRTTEQAEIDIPMRTLVEAGPTPVVIDKQGAGRLYYRIGLRYAPKDLQLKPADHGFTVERAYEGVDDPRDVRRDADGTWRVKAGAAVRVKLTMVAPARRYHVALADPLPAGFEPLNPALATSRRVETQAPANRRGGGWWWWGPWYEHQNLRDQRAEAFASLLWEGVHEYAYVARATTPGTFVVPPPKAEEMYMPETFGRGATDRVVVE